MKNKNFLKKYIIDCSRQLEIDGLGVASVSQYEFLSKCFYNEGLFNDISVLFPNAKSIISGFISYDYEWNNADEKLTGFIAPYTTANFYKLLSTKLEKLGKMIKNYLSVNVKDSEFFRVFVNSKLNDKLAAYSSSLGHVSKNSLITSNAYGSKIVIGSILINIDLPIDSIDINDKCKDCNICIKVCPTKAIRDKKVDRRRCIQSLSSDLDFNYDVLPFWQKRFFGCSLCVDKCPLNRNIIKKNNHEDLIGYIGTTFDLYNILKFKKKDYKTYFRKNQIGSSWVEETVLVRNCLLSFYKIDKDIIKAYMNSIEKYNWEENEKKYLINVCTVLLRL